MGGFSSILFLTIVTGFYAAESPLKPRNMKNDDESGSEYCEPGTFKPKPDNCIFYDQCDDSGVFICQMCPLGTVWVQENETCGYPPNSDHPCWNEIYIPDQADKACKESGNCQRRYFPNPSNCNEYYQCGNGIAYLQECPLGTVWDDPNQTCNFGTDCLEPACGPEPKCTGIPNDKNSSAEYFPCDEDNTKYFECFHGKPLLRPCSDGTYWLDYDPPCGVPCEFDPDCQIVCEGDSDCDAKRERSKIQQPLHRPLAKGHPRNTNAKE